MSDDGEWRWWPRIKYGHIRIRFEVHFIVRGRTLSSLSSSETLKMIDENLFLAFIKFLFIEKTFTTATTTRPEKFKHVVEKNCGWIELLSEHFFSGFWHNYCKIMKISNNFY